MSWTSMNTERTAFPLFVLLSATPFQVKQYSTGSLSFVVITHGMRH
jgi:hypothetical protein